MPLRKNEPYRLYSAVFHPPLYEQPPDSGRFFYPDGVEVPLEKAVKMLCYLKHIVDKYGKQFGVKWRPELIMFGVERLPTEERLEQERIYRYKLEQKGRVERFSDIDEAAEALEEELKSEGRW